MLWNEVWTMAQQKFSDLPDAAQVTRVLLRLFIAVLLGGLLGYDREKNESAADLRTHMLAALGAALFVIVPERAGIRVEELSRVLQGIIAGIGFLGAGAINKLSSPERR